MTAIMETQATADAGIWSMIKLCEELGRSGSIYGGKGMVDGSG